MTLSHLEERLNYHFKTGSLLEMALTHRTWTFEHNAPNQDNQRLEFLGDSILGFVIAEVLYHRHPEFQEGELSRLRSRVVCEAALSILAHELGLEQFIRMGKGEMSSGGACRAGTLADAYEAVIGAIYLDGGFEAARTFVLSHHEGLLEDPDGKWLARDAKTRLQEVVQSEHRDVRYEVLSEEGPVHAPTFEVAVCIDGCQVARGRGRSKKEAQQSAAEEALRLYS